MSNPLENVNKKDLNAQLKTPLTDSQLKKIGKAALQANLKAETAVRTRGADRILFPLRPDEIKLPRLGTKRHLLLVALDIGLTFEQMQKELSWNRDTVSSALYADVKPCGFGLERRGGVLHLLKPENLILTKKKLAFAEVAS